MIHLLLHVVDEVDVSSGEDDEGSKGLCLFCGMTLRFWMVEGCVGGDIGFYDWIFAWIWTCVFKRIWDAKEEKGISGEV